MGAQKNISIARVIARLNVGGPAIQAILMTDAFNRRGFRSILLTGEVATGEASMEYLADSKGVKPLKLDSLARRISVGGDLIALWKLWVTFLREKPAIVHTHTAKAGTLGRIAAVLARVPVRVHTFHGHVFRGYFSKPLTTLFLAIERLLARFTDRIVTVSESQKRELCQEFKIAACEKIDVIPLGFELDPFLEIGGTKGAFRRSLSCPARVPLVGWIGRFAPVKAPSLLVDAAAKCPPELARFVMVGDGELRPFCESRIRDQNLSSRVVILGWRRDLPDIYSDLDLVILTSHNEGTPVALLETMASGRCFIATEAGGVRDLMIGNPLVMPEMEIFENGVLVSRQASAIASAIQYLLDRPGLRDSMGKSGREFVRTKYSVHRLADDLERLYLELAMHKGLISHPIVPLLTIPAPVVVASPDSIPET
ncbi:MAG TPA: glycosyltransferase [Terriglobales bacterium]|nr:glycosyltransferase [Terriglobales bacterium]